MKLLRNNGDGILPEYFLAPHHAFQRTEARIVEHNTEIGNTQLNEGIAHVGRLINLFCQDLYGCLILSPEHSRARIYSLMTQVTHLCI